MVRDFIATALPTKAVCWTLVAASMVCDREYVFMFWRKTTVGGEKEGEKKRGVSLFRPSSLSALGKARKNKIIQSVQLAVDDTTNCAYDFASNP